MPAYTKFLNFVLKVGFETLTNGLCCGIIKKISAGTEMLLGKETKNLKKETGLGEEMQALIVASRFFFSESYLKLIGD